MTIKSTTRDYTKFSIKDHKTGKIYGPYNMAECIKVLLELYIDNHPNYSVQQIIEEWNILNENVKILVGDAPFENRAKCVSCNKGTQNIYVSAQWTHTVFKRLVKFINAKMEDPDWGFELI